ncbi:peptidylprolyl isomerase [Geothermobacter ehrlichii]|uniref:Peptidyl-prolyl cis-trans isomerase n=1 Tax=Geothermobacter ehrlichii TaxID=213224 RepID=A0A5D3WLK4_9BACT|nr:FKBP-type peptidyl-prolyl cis-trans isomerase [Geothermobacter ehrlichii]TYO99592.1 peptidylprolyl isomerase [Geothermobacter ehrlichii]
MSKVKPGDRVSFTFVATLSDGTVFDSSDELHGDDCGCGGEGPLEFTIGGDEVFPALEEAVIGMEVGETRVVELTAEQAFGERDERGIIAVPRSEFPEDFTLQEHMMLELAGDNDEVYPAWVTEIGADFVTLDTNHPLAGEALRYELTLERIVPAH